MNGRVVSIFVATAIIASIPRGNGAEPFPPAVETFAPPERVSKRGLFRASYSIRDASFCNVGAAVDVDGDGLRDLFFASRASQAVSRLNAADGRVVWTRRIAGEQQSLSAFDLAGDDRPEILYTTSSPGRLYVLRDTGEIQNQWDAGDHKLGNSPVIFDADHDGILDGYLGTRSRYLVRLRMSDLTLIDRREEWSQCGCHTTAMDVDGDGRWDLFAGDGDDIRKKGVVHRVDPLTLTSVWSHATDDNASSADPVLVDLDGDGRVEILKSVDNYRGDDAHDAVYAFSTEGRVLWRAPGLPGEDSPNAADLDGDGEIEIVGMTFGCEVYCLGARGQLRWRRDLRPELDDTAHAYLTPILCDLTGDSQLEILAMTNGGYFGPDTVPKSVVANGILFALSARGELLDQLDLGSPRYFGEAFVCQLDSDPHLELALSGSGGLDVISLRGLGPATEYYQRRRTYRRLNVLKWAYEDHDFLRRGTRMRVTHQGDGLVLARDAAGYVSMGRFVTEQLRLPPGCAFRRLHWEGEQPEGTKLWVDVLDAQDRRIQSHVSSGMDLGLRDDIKLSIQFATSDASRTPKLRAYALAFDRIPAVPTR